MRLSATALDLDAFREFVLANGAELDEPRTASGEVLRFKIGHARGNVARRKDGSLTLRTTAVDLYRQFKETK